MINQDDNSSHRTDEPMRDPAHVLYGVLQKKQKIQVWIAESKKKLEGQFVGMDEFMNLTIDSPEEIENNGQRQKLGKSLLLRGDTISLIDCCP